MVSPTTHVLEIENGIGEPSFVPLSTGQELSPLSIGKKGMWRVDSAQSDLQAFVYFDGRTLFVQSADARAQVLANGAPVPRTWTPLSPPGTIELGTTRLRYRALQSSLPAPVASQGKIPQPGPSQPGSSQPGPSAPASIPVPAPASSRAVNAPPSSSRASNAPPSSRRPLPPLGPHVEEPTRIGPVEDTEIARLLLSGSNPTGSPALLSGNFGAAPADEVFNRSATNARFVPSGTSPQRERSPEGPLSKFQSLPPPMKALIFMVPFLIVGVLLLLVDEEPPAPTRRPTARKTVTTTAAPSPAIVATATGSSSSDRASLASSDTQAPRASAGTEPTPHPGAASGDAGADEPPPGVPTLERQAVDAVAAGNYVKAIGFYDQLAQHNPDRPAFAEAARILRAKVDAGAP